MLKHASLIIINLAAKGKTEKIVAHLVSLLKEFVFWQILNTRRKYTNNINTSKIVDGKQSI